MSQKTLQQSRFLGCAFQLKAAGMLLAICLAAGLSRGEAFAQTVCSDGSAGRAATQLNCASPDQLQSLLDYEKTPGEDEDAVRDLLITAGLIADCLKDEQLFPLVYRRQQDFLCLQQKLLAFYARAGDGMLRFEDRLARASIANRHCIYPEDYPSPDGSGDTGDCGSLIGMALIDYRTVFAAAHQLKREPGRYSSAFLAEKLGMDPFDPAPDYELLQEFIDMSVRSADGHPDLGRQIGSALGPTLCDALLLYPGQQEEATHAYNLLIRFDGGNMAGTAQFYKADKRLSEIFHLDPSDWSSTPPCQPSQGEFDLPAYKVARQGARSGGDLEASLTEVDETLKLGAARLSDKSQSWKPFYRYGSLLFEMARSLRVPSGRSSTARDRQHLFVKASCDALLNGVRLSHPPVTDKDLNKIRSAFTAQVREYGTALRRSLRFQELIDFVSRYLEPVSEGIAEDGQQALRSSLTAEDLLSQAQQQQLHRLMAEAYYLKAATTPDRREKRILNAQVLKHLRKSDTTITELEQLRDEMRRSGVRIWR